VIRTSQFRLFATEPGERVLARPRHLLQEGRLADAERAYLGVLQERPDLALAWGEYFQLLRSERRFEEALALAGRAARHVEDGAFTDALTGAALVELGRYREGLAALERAAGRAPDLALVWHEAGYAAYRLGEPARALAALDRAFALEPHSGTLHLRGRILQDAGRFLAAEVAFTAALEAAELPVQQAEAERQLGVTRRLASFGMRPAALGLHRRWFAETAGTPLCGPGRMPGADEATVLRAFVALAGELGWSFTAVLPADEWPGWQLLADLLDVPLVPDPGEDWPGVPLVACHRVSTGGARWLDWADRVARGRSGLALALDHDPAADPVDVAGRLDGLGGPWPDPATALQAARHPEGRLWGRRLR
jgi:tetratricopeptide (TPR) repeat protein